MPVTIYHNPRCSKSRQALKILNERSIGFVVKEYLREPPTVEELTEVIQKLRIRPMELIRKEESVFRENFKEQELTDEEWIKVMVKNPILIERPIVIKDNKATIGRPSESILDVLTE